MGERVSWRLKGSLSAIVEPKLIEPFPDTATIPRQQWNKSDGEALMLRHVPQFVGGFPKKHS